MMIPCIDLQDGRAVQLVHGRERSLPWTMSSACWTASASYPLIHVIDLDAAMRKGTNAEIGARTVRRGEKSARCASAWAAEFAPWRRPRGSPAWGAEKVIIGSAAFKDGRVNEGFLRRLAAEDWTAAGHRRAGHRGRKNSGARLAGQTAAAARRSHSRTRKIRLGIFVHLRGRGRHHARHKSRTGSAHCADATRLPITAAGGIRSRQEIRALARIKWTPRLAWRCTPANLS